MAAMSRLSTVCSARWLGVAVAFALAVPSLPAQAAGPDGSVLFAKAKKKKPTGKKKPGKKPPKAAATPEIEKGMKVVTMADAVVVKEPEEGAKQVFNASEGQVLTVVKVQKKWVQVKNADGKQGWLQAAEVVPKEVYDAKAEDEGGGGDEGGNDDKGGGEPTHADEGGGGDEGGAVASADEDGGKKKKKHADDEDGGGAEGGASASTELKGRARLDGKLRLAAGAELIGLIRSQEFASGGMKPYSNYTINVSSPGAEVFARVTRKGGKLELGAELSFLTTFGNGGVTVGSGADAQTLAWAETQFDGRVLVGYHIASGVLVSARVGYRFMTINIDDSAAILQPSEQLGGVSLGAEAVLYGLSPKLELRLGAETLVAASLTQTDTRKDGDASTVSPVYLFAEAAYLVSPRLQIVGSYNLGYESYAWTGVSQRAVENTNSKRKDLQHTFAIGAQFWF
jgi:hypothetical protein